MKGKATQNEDTVEKLNIKDKDFLVVMATVKVLFCLKFRNLKPKNNRSKYSKRNSKSQQPSLKSKTKPNPKKKHRKNNRIKPKTLLLKIRSHS